MVDTARPGTYDLIQDATVKSYATAKAEIPRTLTGAARNLYELIAGRSARTGEPATSGLNPSGDVGVNYSGPPWGSAYRHTIAHGGCNVDDTDMDTPEYGYFVGENAIAILENGNSGNGYAEKYVISQPVYHRAFQDLGDKSPYARLYLYVKAVAMTGGTTTLQIYDDTENLTEARRAQVSVTTGTRTWYNTGLWVRASPTGVTQAKITMRVISSSTNAVLIEQWTLDQIAKRSH